MTLGEARIVQGNALALPLPDASIDLICTSPPYFGLRSYQDNGQHYDGQIGSEATPAEFLDALIAATGEMVRVLKPSGSIFVNLGDKYAVRRAPGQPGTSSAVGKNTSRSFNDYRMPDWQGIREKSLIGIPWRYAIRCIDELGLILRAEIIWSKPNGLPESVTDRVRRSHEQWFCFQQSGDEIVEGDPQALPFCPLCGRPKDARATLVQRLHELDASVQDCDLADQVGTDERVEIKRGVSSEQPGMVGLGGASVPFAVPGDADFIENPADLLHDGQVAVVDHDSEMRAASPAVAERNTALSVDDSGQPRKVCSCSHPFILDDEPWIPQSLAAELMQMVADGTADAQHVADFLSGNYARTHSTWFHFTVQPRYFAAVDEIREETTRIGLTWEERKATNARTHAPDNGHMSGGPGMAANPLGKLPGSVWTIPTQPLTVPPELGVDHFAAYPMEWPRRIIQGWTPNGICTACDQPRRPVTETSYEVRRKHSGNPDNKTMRRAAEGNGNPFAAASKGGFMGAQIATITGYACDCGEWSHDAVQPSTRPAVVLDPFGGTGTTALVAKALGRTGISVDLSMDYCRLATWRCNDPGQLAAALKVEKPEPISADQLGLFDEEPVA